MANLKDLAEQYNLMPYQKPCAAEGYTSYRYPSGYGGWIMIGAKDHADAINEANRSLYRREATYDRLQVWSGNRYINVLERGQIMQNEISIPQRRAEK